MKTNIDSMSSAFSTAVDMGKTPSQIEAEARHAAIKAEREAQASAKGPGVLARNAVLEALKESLAEDAQEAIESGASPRMEMALTAAHSHEGSAIMYALGQPAKGAYLSVQANVADRADQSASPLRVFRGIPVLQTLARSNVTPFSALAHQQTKLLSKLNRSGEELAESLQGLRAAMSTK